VLYAVTMNDSRSQHLAGAFNSIIAMMLASLRARGLRGLLDLPKTILLGLYLRRIGKEFAAIIASVDLGNLPPPRPPGPARLANRACATRSRTPRLATSGRTPRRQSRPPAASANLSPSRRNHPSANPHAPTLRHQAYVRPRRAPDRAPSPISHPTLRVADRRS